MTYIQLSLAGIPAIVQQRNSLTDKAYSEPFLTPIFVLDRWAHRLNLHNAFKILDESAAQSKADVKANVAESVSTEEVKPVQLSLF